MCVSPCPIPGAPSLVLWLRYERSLASAQDAMAAEDDGVTQERQRVERLYSEAFPGGNDVNGDGLASPGTGNSCPGLRAEGFTLSTWYTVGADE